MPRRSRAAVGGPVVEMMLADLARSGLTAADVQAMRLRPGDPSELEALGLPALASYVIPYLDAGGRETGFRRWRYLEDRRLGEPRTDGKPLRYVQAGSSMPELYLPPNADWPALMADASQPLLVTEGEKKAYAATAAGHPCLGLGGVYSFKSKRRGVPFIKALRDFSWDGRDVVVAFDSDAATNTMVVAARNELCRALTELGAVPRVADVPEGTDEATGRRFRQGVDDLLVHGGPAALAEAVAAAESYAMAAALHELSEEVAYVRNPGVVVVMADGRKMRPFDFTAHAYSNRHYWEEVQTRDGSKMVRRKAAQAWLEWEHRTELARMDYVPGAPRVCDGDVYNTWPGWGCEPGRGPVGPWRDLMDRMFRGHPEERRWFERWLALPLQRPGSKMFTCCLLWGAEEGTGKSAVGKTMGRIYGQNYALLNEKVMSSDSRNEWAQEKQFVLGDDVTGHDNRRHAESLKVTITQERIRIDPKFIPSFWVRDVLNYLFTSNRPDAFFLDDNDRRNFVWEVACPPMTKAEVAEYFAWLDGGGASHLFHHLLALDLGGMEASDRAPWTNAKDAMVEDSQSALGRWCRDLRREPGHVLVAGGAPLEGDLWSSADLLRAYDPEDRRGTTASAVSREAKRAGLRLAYRGMPVPTPAGQRRLFVVRDEDRWLEAGASKLAEHYAATRLRRPAKAAPLKKVKG